MHRLLTWLDATAVTEATEAADATGLNSMTDSMDYIMLLLLVGLGLYMLYTVFKLKRECMLFDSKILYPGNCPKDECLDPDGFMDYISPRMLILAVCLLVMGGLFALNKWVLGFTGTVITILEVALPILAVGWYFTVCHKAAKEFWDK